MGVEGGAVHGIGVDHGVQDALDSLAHGGNDLRIVFIVDQLGDPLANTYTCANGKLLKKHGEKKTHTVSELEIK